MNENPSKGKGYRRFSISGAVALVTVLLVILLPASTCFSAGLWGPQGVSICSAYAYQDSSCIVSDAAGGAIIAWQDERGPDYDYNIYAQRVDPSGNILWAEQGIPIYVDNYDAYDPESVSDGAGGAIITWRDYRNGASHIFAQRINPAGQVLWAANGVPVCTADYCYEDVITSDGAGGAIITWRDDRNTDYDIYAQKIDASGNAVWPVDGVQICTAADDQYSPQIVPGGSGSAVVTWEDDRNGDGQYDIYAQKVSAAGVVQWAADGVPVSTAAGDKYNPMITSSGSGSAIITWADERSGGHPNVYAQKLNSQGAAQWPANGVAVCNADGGQDDPNIVSDDAGGAVIAWHDRRSDTQLIYAQKVNSDGTPGWATNGVAVNSTYAGWDPISMYPDGMGGAFICWDTLSYYFILGHKAGMSGGNGGPGLLDSDIRIQKMMANGQYSPGWGPNGLSASNTEALKVEPVMTTDGEGGVIVAWSQADEGLDELNIWAQRMVATTSNWYLAEGSQSWGFDAYITLENPNQEAATARVTFMTPDGPTTPRNIALPPQSQTTISPKNIIGYETDFSTKVQCLEGLSIAVDRTMFWTGINAPSPEAHSSIGVNSPSTTWYLPEGSSAWGFECWLLIQNPNNTEATCTLTYMIEGQNPQQFEKKIPADSRQSMNMAEYIGANDASIMVSSNLPVVAERSMYRDQRREGHESVGTTQTSTDYYLAEGSTAWGFDTYILIQNPNGNPAVVTVNYMTPEGPVTMDPVSMAPYSRKTINAADSLPNRDFSTQVHSDQPIIAERAMYWGAGTPLGEAMHDSIGMPEPHRIFYLPDGQSSEGRETFTLVQNLNTVPVEVEISYLTPDGAGNQVFTETIPALSRVTYNLADKIPDGRAAVVVECITSGKKIMAERAMYWNNRGVGTSTIGGFSN